jgi:hypothetical protein
MTHSAEAVLLTTQPNDMHLDLFILLRIFLRL